MGDWRPLFYSLGILFVLGFVFPLVLSGFFDINQIVLSPFFNTLVNFITNGVSFDIPVLSTFFGSVSFDPFSLFGDNFVSFVTSQLIYISVIPNIILIPLSIMMIVGFVYSIVSLVLP